MHKLNLQTFPNSVHNVEFKKDFKYILKMGSKNCLSQVSFFVDDRDDTAVTIWEEKQPILPFGLEMNVFV